MGGIATSGFSHTLHAVYQEFKQVLDAFMAETINPRVIQFIRISEDRIRENFESIAAPFDAMSKEALVEYNISMRQFGISIQPETRHPIDLADMDSIKTTAGLSLPPAVAVMHYTARLRTEATLRLGFYSSAKALKRVLKKPIKNQKEDALLALRDGIIRMKKETEKSVVSHFKDYKENLKFQYLFPLVDAVSTALHNVLNDRFQALNTDLSMMVAQVNRRQVDHQQVLASLNSMERWVHKIQEKIKDLRVQIDE
jgi:hypothetical protein